MFVFFTGINEKTHKSRFYTVHQYKHRVLHFFCHDTTTSFVRRWFTITGLCFHPEKQSTFVRTRYDGSIRVVVFGIPQRSGMVGAHDCGSQSFNRLSSNVWDVDAGGGFTSVSSIVYRVHLNHCAFGGSAV